MCRRRLLFLSAWQLLGVSCFSLCVANLGQGGLQTAADRARARNLCCRALSHGWLHKVLSMFLIGSSISLWSGLVKRG